MKNRRHTSEQVIRKLTEADKLLAQGKTVEEVARHLEISEKTFHRWRNQYGGMKADDAKRLKELEKENQRLKKIVADQALDIDMLKELAEANFWPRTAADELSTSSLPGPEYLNAGRAACRPGPIDPALGPTGARRREARPAGLLALLLAPSSRLGLEEGDAGGTRCSLEGQ